jgi:hypothetical protein
MKRPLAQPLGSGRPQQQQTGEHLAQVATDFVTRQDAGQRLLARILPSARFSAHGIAVFGKQQHAVEIRGNVEALEHAQPTGVTEGLGAQHRMLLADLVKRQACFVVQSVLHPLHVRGRPFGKRPMLMRGDRRLKRNGVAFHEAFLPQAIDRPVRQCLAERQSTEQIGPAPAGVKGTDRWRKRQPGTARGFHLRPERVGRRLFHGQPDARDFQRPEDHVGRGWRHVAIALCHAGPTASPDRVEAVPAVACGRFRWRCPQAASCSAGARTPARQT